MYNTSEYTFAAQCFQTVTTQPNKSARESQHNLCVTGETPAMPWVVSNSQQHPVRDSGTMQSLLLSLGLRALPCKPGGPRPKLCLRKYPTVASRSSVIVLRAGSLVVNGWAVHFHLLKGSTRFLLISGDDP